MCRVRPNFVVIALPAGQHGARLSQRGEQRLVEAFITQPADEALGKRILLRLARRDVMPAHLAVLAPGQDRGAGQLRAIVADAQQRMDTAAGDDRLQLPDDAFAGQRCISDQAEAFAGEVVDDYMRNRRPSVSVSDAKSSDQR